MVTIIGTEQRTSGDGRKFNVLLLSGGIDVVKSKRTGKQYVTSHKVSIVCTLDERSAKAWIGSKLPGTIQKVACDPYDFKLPHSDEIVRLDYTFEYSKNAVNSEEAAFAD